MNTIKTTSQKNLLKAVAIASLFAALALILQFSLEAITTNKDWLFFYPAVFASAWLGGAIGGYICTLICMLFAQYYFIHPINQFTGSQPEAYIEVVIFLVMGFFISHLIARLQRTELEVQQQAELEKSRSFLNSLLENIPLMVFVKEAKELRFVRFNKAGEDLIGHDREVLIGKNDYDFFPKDQADHFIAKDREVLAGNQIVDIQEEPIETRLKGTRILHTKKIPLYGSDGKPEYLLGVSEDITDKKFTQDQQIKILQEQAALRERESNQRRESLLAGASTLLASSLDYHQTLKALARLSVTSLGDWCVITMQEKDGHYTRNTGAHKDKLKIPLIEKLIQYPPDETVIKVISGEMSGQSLFIPHIEDSEIKRWADSERKYDLIKELGANSTMIVPIRSRDKVLGAIHFSAGTSSPEFTEQDLSLAEELGRRAGIAVDNALLYASAQSAIKARDEFMSIASHELKTPITSLKMQLQMLQRSIRPDSKQLPAPEKIVSSLENSNRQIDRLTVLIEDLLDVSRIETGKLTYKMEKVNLHELLTEVIERFSEQFKVLGGGAELSLEKELYCVCDRYRIEQVITNLLTNAIKYGGGSKVNVKLEKFFETAVIEVRDYGMGIPKSSQKKIFERFERAVSSANISGLGLGLYISKQIIDAHKGKIEVESEVGQGSLFRVILPLHHS